MKSGQVKWNWIAAATGLVLVAVFAVHFINYAPDDVWISLRYAQNLASGQGLTFNPGERVEGYSNFLWVLLNAAIAASATPYQLTLAAKLIGVVSSLLAVLLIAWAAWKLPMEPEAKPYWGAAALGFGLYGFPAFWAATGMETGFYTLLVTGAIVAHLGLIQCRCLITATLSALLCLAVALTRPEGILFFVAMLLTLGILLFRTRQRPTLDLLLYAGIVIVGYGAFLLWRHAYFGQWLPNTFYAKAGGGAAKYAEGARYLLLNLPRLLWSNPVLALAFALPFLDWKNLKAPVLLAGGWVGLQALFAFYAGGDWMEGARFLVPAMPAMALLAPVALGRVLQAGLPTQKAFANKTAATVLILAVCGCAAIHLYQAKQVRHDVSGFRTYDGAQYFKPDHFAVAQWLEKNGSRTDLVALGEAGLIPFLTGQRALDLFGLMDPYLARLPGLRHQKFDPGYVFDRHPRFIVLGGCKIWSDSISSDFEYARSLLADPRLTRDYLRAFTHHTFLVYQRKSTQE